NVRRTPDEFEGGIKSGVRNIRFPAPKPMAAPPKGRTATVKHANMKYPSYQVVNLEGLYAQGGEWKTHSTLYFNDPSKSELADIGKMTQMRSGGTNYEVLFTTGKKAFKVLLTEPRKGADFPSDMEMVGFVGRFSAGYRVFPI